MNRELPGVNLGLEKEEEPEIKLPTFAGSQRKHGISGKNKKPLSVSLTTLKPLTVWIMANCGKLFDGNTRPSDLDPEKPVCGSRSNS